VILVWITASAIAASQNPNPPYVNLPPGWRADYGTVFQSGAEIKGPDGEVIMFPAYSATGSVASVQREMDIKATIFRALIDGRRVDVTITSRGLLAVSFPPPTPSQFGSGGFDYWTQTRDVRQVVKALMIILSYLDVRTKTNLPVEEVKDFSKPSENHPFAHLVTGWEFPYDKQEAHFRRSEDVTWKKPSIVEATTREFPVRARWIESSSLLGGTLSTAEADDGSFWAKYLAHDGKAVSFVARQGDGDAAVLAILATLTYFRGSPGGWPGTLTEFLTDSRSRSLFS